jgi:hypothetical protein
MRSRKVFRIYAALQEEERTAFGLYLASPYFHHGTRLQHFRTLLEDALIKQPGQSLSAEDIWQRLPDVTTEFRPNGFDKLCSELLAAIHDFLALQEFRAHPATVGSHLLAAYVERHLDEWVPNVHEGLMERMRGELDQDAAGLYADLQMEERLGEFVFRQPRMPRNETLLQIDKKLNAFFIAKKLEVASLVDIFNRSYNATLKLPYLGIIEEAVKEGNEGFPILIRLRATAWLLTSTREDRYYWQLKEALLLATDIARDQQRPLFHLALNHCAYKLNIGDMDFELEADSIHLEMIARQLFLVDGKFPPEQFKNIIQLRLVLGERDWVQDFLDTWGGRLSNDHQGCAILYNRAVLAFYQKSFAACFRGMEQVLREFKDDIYYGTDARIYQLMCLFEMGKSEDTLVEFDARLNAFRVYLIRDNRIGESLKQRYLNSVKQFRKLTSLVRQVPSQQRHLAGKFLKELDKLKPASNRRWFLEQVRPYLVP